MRGHGRSIESVSEEVIIRDAPRVRRAPPSEAAAKRYRALVRESRRKRAPRRRPLWVNALFTVGMLLVGAAIVYRGAVALSARADAFDLNAVIVNAFPSAQPQVLQIEQPNVNASAAPIADGLADFTSIPQQLLQGHVPGFALAPNSKVEVQLNGKLLVSVPVDDQGRFAAPLVLVEGPNAVVTTLLRGTEVVNSSSWNIVLKRMPPAVTLVRPKAGDVVDGRSVIVEGKSEPRATVRVNERIVTATQDGSFSDTFTANPGPLVIQVVARDQAGNETVVKIPVTVKTPDATTAGPAMKVTLDRTSVKPGESVIADIVLTDAGIAKPDTTVTLQVGVITIGTAKTDVFGRAKIGFAAPTTEGTISVVVLGGNATGSAILTVAK